jgi:hypothetical protein
MARKRYTPETIIRKLREAEILQGQGLTVVQAVKKLGVSEQTFCAGAKSTEACALIRPND